MASCLPPRKVWYTFLVTILMVYPGSTAATRSSTTAHWVVVAPGWNLLSLPAGVANCSTHALFPTAISPAYVFEPGVGYVVRDTLRPGEGFWLRFGTADTLLVHGESLLEHNVDLDSGWNLVGALSVPINAPRNNWPWGGLLASEFFRYVPDVGLQADTVLRPGTGYWVKASAPGSIFLAGPGGGPCAVTPTVEYEGKTYNTVQIGTQCWLRENLDVGRMIPGSQDQTNNGTSEKYCYNDDTIYCAAFGGLYQWDEVMQYDTTQGVQGNCPPGWHVPTLAEFQMLSATVGGDGNALKAIGQGADSGAGTNTSGFSGLLAGFRGSSGHFFELGYYGDLWSSTRYRIPLRARYLSLSYSLGGVYIGYDYTTNGYGVRCLRDNLPPEIPSGPTPPDGSVGQSPGIRLGWNCADPDGHAITYDVYAGITNPPVTPVALGESNASVGLTGLAGSSVYYWRVVARDEHGDTTAGPVWSFTTGAIGGSPCPGTPTVTYAGKTYNTVLIGAQCWLRENLDVGTMVPGSQFQTGNDTIEKYCYDNNPANCAAYGGLYQWDEAMQYIPVQGARGICPPGWHIPTLAEFQTLSSTVSGDGNALKAIGQGNDGGQGTNTSGFSALLAGNRHYNGYFQFLGGNGGIWSSTHNGASYAHGLSLGSNIPGGLSGYYRNGGVSLRCLKGGSPPDEPSQATPPDGAVGQSPSVMLGWSCSDPDGDPLTYDVYLGPVNPPGTMVSSRQPGTAFGTNGLSGGTTYYWRVVARDTHADTTTSPVWSFTTGAIGGSPCPGTPTVTYAGKIYNTAQIGSQCWLRENLDVGTMVLGAYEQTDNDTIEKYCYDDNPVNCATYGGLYQWNEAMQYSTMPGARGNCPPGWHLPTVAEFQALGATVGGVGNPLKAIGQGSGDGAGTNTSGFSALLAGYRYHGGGFYYLGDYGNFWSSTQQSVTYGHCLTLTYNNAYLSLGYDFKSYGFSVRCLKD